MIQIIKWLNFQKIPEDLVRVVQLQTLGLGAPSSGQISHLPIWMAQEPVFLVFSLEFVI